MKKVIVILIALSFGTLTSAQKIREADVPTEVKTTFASNYPNTPVIRWKKAEGKFEAMFTKGGSEVFVTILPEGSWDQTKTYISNSALPNAALSYMATTYSGHPISDAWRIDFSSGEITYTAEIKDIWLIFNSAGKYLRSEFKKPVQKAKKES